jgi:hypothetical protein
VGTQSDFIQPNASGLGRSFSALTISPWTQNGITWIASSSSVFDVNNSINYAFDNSSSGGEWVPLSSTYTTAGNTSGQTTTIQTIGTVTGEWLQIESSVPLIMASYQFATGNVVSRTPRTYYIVGNNSGNTWFPIQYGAGGAVTTTPQFTTVPGIITVNSASTQIFGSSTITTTTYATTTNAYTRFRLICLSNYSVSNDVVSLGEWFVNFLYPLTVSRPAASMLSLNHTGQYQLVATGPAAGSIMPNRTGLTAATWTQSGVNWGVSASSSFAGYPVFNTFNNTSSSWLSDNTIQRYTNGSPNGNAASTNIQTIGPTAGEWVQIQSSVPLVLTSFAFGIGVNAYPGTATPKIYYIVGSNDGSTWVPLQFGNFTISAFTGISVPINMNTTGTQTLTSTMVGSVATTAYSFTTNAYTYFRLIGTSLMVYGGSSGTTYMEVGEWYMNFSNSVSYSSNYGATWLNTSRTVSNESVALSPSGQYALSTNSVAPLARLTLDNTNLDAQGVLAPTTGAGTVTYPGTQYKVGNNAAFFNQTAGSTTPTMYLNYIVPTVLNTPSVLTMSCWMYMSTMPASGISIPMSFSDTGNTVGGVSFFVFTNGTHMSFAYTTTISGYAEITYGTPVLTNVWYHLVGVASAGVAQFYVNGTLIGSRTYSGLLCLSGGGNMSRLMVGAQYTSGQFAGAFHGYVDDVRLYTSALNADEINGLFRNPALTQTIAVSNSYLPITSYTEPVLPDITANVVDTAVSQTGQYMVAVTSSTTNNVYYSTDFGATFTALTIGSSAMVSCSISYDGTYLTVTNATTTYTLNENTRGFTLAIGNQAGRINQGLNAIAIGDKAGQTNQSNNSIVLNATGAALDAVVPGFYVAPVATAGSSSAAPFNLLGYGTDNQIVQSSALTVLQNGNMGISMANPVAPLHINQTLSSNSYYSTFGTASAMPAQLIIESPNIHRLYLGSYYTGGQGEMSVIQSSSYFSSTDHPGTLLLNPNGGLVGIGTTAPTSALQVSASNANATTTLTVSNAANSSTGFGARLLFDNFSGQGLGSIAALRTETSQDWKSYMAFSVSSGPPNSLFEAMRITQDGRLGIGTAAPGVTLDVVGTIRNGGMSIVSNNPQPLVFFNSSGPYNWNVGGQNDGTFRIFAGTFNGVQVGWAGTSWSAISDRRLKEDIESLDNCLSKIVSLNPVSYRMINRPSTLTKKQFGLIAQEVLDVIPDIVESSWNDTAEENYYSLLYTELVPFLIGAIKEQNITIVSQAAENAALQAQLTPLITWAKTQGFS